MTIYPAIDLRHGKVVRLKHGDPKQQATYSDDPLATARGWAEAGAHWVHVVNLDGAFGDQAGAAVNRSLLQSLAAVGPRIQFGGGLRSLADIEAALTHGAARVVIGTLAIEQPAVLREAVGRFGSDRVVVGLDTRQGRVKTRGWQSDGGTDAITLGRQIRSAGVNLVVHTDIAAALSRGAARVVVGTLAIEQPEVLREAAERFGSERVVVGLDAQGGRVKTRGWQSDGGSAVIAIGRQIRSAGVTLVVHTDIGRDGDLSGVNRAASIELARETGLQVIASGGVNSIADVLRLNDIAGIEGVIIGRALYTGAIDLRQLFSLLRGA